jgi:uncharacterized NAD-dependent epimerase/dehydratase family protein
VLTALHEINHTPLVLWAEGCLGQPAGKTASGVILYGHWPIVAVIDSTQAGKSVKDIFPNATVEAPVLASLQDALKLRPAAFMIGIAPPGGGLPSNCRDAIKTAIGHGISVISGLHTFLNDDPELVALAQQQQVRLWDVRHWPKQTTITRHLPRPTNTTVITFVGSDCAIGKMVSALEMHKAACQAGQQSHFVATGQTGIMINGHGIPLDSLVADFAAGITEAEIAQYYTQDYTQGDANQPSWIWVEGQGSLLHPAYSGVTLSLIHGSCPDGLILCHRAGDTHIRHYTVPIPPLAQLVNLYETVCNASRPATMKPARVIGIAVNTSLLSAKAAETYCTEVRQQTGLPVADPIRHGVMDLWAACQHAL